MNKLKEQLRLKMLGQLSDEKTEVDVNNAYDVAVDFCLSFTSFVGENILSYKEGIWRMKKLKPEFKTTEELINFFLPKMYCYFGSGMLTNTYDNDVALQHAKECALFHIKGLYEFGDSLKVREPLMFFNTVEREIKKM